MVGFLIGIAGGCIELALLSRLIHAVQAGAAGKVALFMLCKLAVLAAAFIPVILAFRGQLLYCGIGISVPLVFGSFLRFLWPPKQGPEKNVERKKET